MTLISDLMTRKRVTLSNPLDRSFVQQLIADAASLQAEMALWRPYRCITPLECAILETLTEDAILRDVLGRLPLRLGSPLEQRLLAEDLAAYGSLNAPSDLLATPDGTATIDLSWTDNSGGTAATRIERSNDGVSGWVVIDTVPAGQTTYSDTSLPAGTTRYYRAQHTTGALFSAYSNVDSATTVSFDELLAAYVAAGRLKLWWKMDADATPVLNYGSLGSAYNITTLSAVTTGQSSPLGAERAFEYDGATGFARAPLPNLQTFTLAMLVYPRTGGEGPDKGRMIFAFDTITQTMFENSAALKAQRNGVTDPTTVTTSIMALNDWSWHIVDLTAAAFHDMFNGRDGLVSEYGYSQRDAGATLSVNTETCYFGNISAQTRTWDGFIGDSLVFDPPLSAAEKLEFVRASGV